MPPGLISSAAPGKKATAPKAAPRRRAAVAVLTGSAQSAGAVPDATTSIAPPTPEPTQNQSQTPVVEDAVQQEGEVRLRETGVEVEASRHATAAPETVAEHVPPPRPVGTADAVERERELGDISTAVPTTPEATHTQFSQQTELEKSGEEVRRQEEARHEVEIFTRQESLRRESRQAQAREAARTQESAVQARQVAEQQEETRQNEVYATSNAAPPRSPAVPPSTAEVNAPSVFSYVPPSASSATPATVDPTTLPLTTRSAAAPKASTKRSRTDQTSAALARPAKKAKTSSTRSNAKVQAAVNGADDEGMEPSVASTTETDATQPKPNSKAKRKPATRKTVAAQKRTMSVATIQNSDDETEGQGGEEEEQEDSLPAPRKQRKPRAERVTKKKSAKLTNGNEDGETVAEDEGVPGEGTQDNAEEGGESDPELHEIDPNTMSMWELSRDERHGKKSERGKKMEEIDWEKVAQDRRDAANALVASFRTELQPQAGPSDDVVTSVEGPSDTADPDASQGRRSQSRAGTTAAADPTPAPANDDLGLGFILDADGNIVADENTLTFTRDAAAQAAANSEAPIEEFTDLTQNINRFTHLNANRRDPADRLPLWRSKSDPWSEDETDKFYDALRMFGTDFFIISKMFAPKTRRMIKNKFTREERLDPNRITRALTGIVETPMSLEHYSRETGFAMENFTKYDGVQHAQSVIDSENVGKEVVDEKEAKRREKELAKEEKEREKEREKEERRAKRKARTKKGIAEAGGAGFGGGGPVESVVGEAE